MRYIPLQILATLAICLTAAATKYPLPLRIDLGNVDSGTGVNNLSNHTSGSVSPLVNMVGTSQANHSAAVTNGFVGVNSTGTQSPSASITLPATGSQDSFYGNDTDATGEIRLTLPNYRLYNLRFFASVTGVSDNRETLYTVIGVNTTSGSLNPSNNTSNHLELLGIGPDSNGHITIRVSKGPNNTNADGSFYLGWLEVVPTTSSNNVVPTKTGALYVAGKNVEHSLSPGTNNANIILLQAPEHPAGTRNPDLETGVVSIATGTGTVFVKKDGTIWGMGIKREIGIPYDSNDQVQENPTRLNYADGSPITTATECAAHGGNVLFIRSDGTLWGMGLNDYGELGIGSTAGPKLATQVTDGTLAYTNVTSIAVGYRFSAFISAGKVYVMGTNTFGLSGTQYNYPRPLSATITNAKKVSANGSHLVILTTTGAMYTMGSNSNGQCGTGDRTNPTEPHPVLSSGVLDVAAGGFHTTFVLDEGGSKKVRGMGYSYHGSLGNYSDGDRLNPVDVYTTTNVVSVACGVIQSYFIDESHNLIGVGVNTNGQLGVALNTDGYYRLPQTISSNVVRVSANGAHVVAIYQYEQIIEVADNDTDEAIPIGGTGYIGTTDGSAVLKTFRIANTGHRDLAVTGVTFAGGQASDFTLETAPPSTIAGGGSGTFTVRFTPGDVGPRTTTVSIGNDDPATGKNPYTFTLNAATHTAPVVEAGDRIVVNPPHTFPVVVELKGTVTDDGLPGPLTRNWSVTTTPPGVDLASVTFTAADQDSTSVSLPSAGAYVFALTANDSAATTTDSVSVILNITVPTVFAGEEKWIGMDNLETPVVGSVTGTASDTDNLPDALTTTWRLKQGNNAVVIANPNQLTTNVTFSAPGEYVLELEAYDGGAKTTSTMTYYVGARPEVSAGEDITIYYPETTQVTIDATVVGANEIQWAKVTGPDGCTITGATVANPVITFTQDGIYTFQVSATFGDVSETDTVTITVIHRTNIFPARGYAGIGTVTPGEHLEVLGKVKAADLIVTTKGADYVFGKDYKLKALAEVEAFIKRHKHLPGIAPAAEMQRNGMKVSQLATLQLAKIEELTLHTIALKKRNEALRKQNAETEKLIKAISQQLDRLEQNQGGLE